MASAANYGDLDENIGSEAVLPEDIESPDFTTRKTMPVGSYISQSRTILAKTYDDGHIGFQIELTGGLTFKENGSKWGERFPLKAYPSTRPFKQDGVAGSTSSIAGYLRACGVNPKGLTVEQIKDAVKESQTVPVEVFIGRTDKGVKQGDGSFTSANLKTKDFNIGTKENPVYAESVVKDNVTYEAKPKVGSFSPLTA